MGVCRSKPVQPFDNAVGAGGAAKSNQVAPLGPPPDLQAVEATKDGPAVSLTLLMLGIDDAGKTSCVNVLRKEPGARALPTSGFSKPQKIALGQHKLTLLDLGGGRRIRDIWREYFAEVHAVVFVVDSSNRERSTEAAEALTAAVSHEYLRGKPVLVACTKKELPNAYSVDELRGLVMLPSDAPAPVQYVTGTAKKLPDGTSDTAWLFDGVGWLVNTVREQFEALNARVVAETAAKKEANRQKVEKQKAKIESDAWKAGQTDIDGNALPGGDAAAGTSGSADAAPAAEEEDAGPKCSICKTAAAERRCAAAKWEAVCNPCGEQLEASTS